tara:strand:- start:428 stop:598 length:171 start_codon:yes stop_codon:yes gene_type:complete
MANTKAPSKKKKTRQGSGKFSKKTSSGGEVFHGVVRSGSPPSKFHAKKKPSRGQGR